MPKVGQSVEIGYKLEDAAYRKCYIGLDPGGSGGIAFVSGDGRSVSLITTGNLTPHSVAAHLRVATAMPKAYYFATVEQQIPRPTRWFNGKVWASSILKSTCLLYGNYQRLLGYLTALCIPYEEVTPQRWQKAFGLVKKKGEAPSKWKNRLKAKAQSLFPQEKITLATADALLIAEYARRKGEGLLKG